MFFIWSVLRDLGQSKPKKANISKVSKCECDNKLKMVGVEEHNKWGSIKESQEKKEIVGTIRKSKLIQHILRSI